MEKFNDVLRSKKTGFLRAIGANIAGDDLVPEVLLGYLEIVVEMDRAVGNSMSASLSAAHCIVALQCAVEYLVKGNVKKGSKFLGDVDRMWGPRFEKLETCGESKSVIVAELRKLRGAVELSVNDTTERAKLAKLSVREKALDLVLVYLREEGIVEIGDKLAPSSDVFIGSERPTNENQEKAVPLSPHKSMPHKSVIVAIDELDDCADGSPKVKKCEPKPKIEADDSPRTKMRRPIRKWSSREEETLIQAVAKFGKAWKLIWTAHRDEFSERTDVDLKDKWRNMTKSLN